MYLLKKINSVEAKKEKRDLDLARFHPMHINAYSIHMVTYTLEIIYKYMYTYENIVLYTRVCI